MFGGFSGISADDYGRRTGQRSWLGSARSPAGPRLGAVGPTTVPQCLCDLQRKADRERDKTPDNRMRRSS